jgi:hypothetical protein
MPNILVVKVSSLPVVNTLKVFTASFFYFQLFQTHIGNYEAKSCLLYLEEVLRTFLLHQFHYHLWCEHSSPTHHDRCSRNKIALSPMDGRRVILAIKCNVHDMLFLHGQLLAMLVSDPLLFALSFLLVWTTTVSFQMFSAPLQVLA